MMRLGLRGMVWMSVCLLIAGTAMAQGQGGGQGRGGRGGFGFGGMMGGGGGMLLNLEQVQKELKLDDAQKEKLKTIRDEAQAAGGGRGAFANFQEMSQEEREKAFAEMRKRMEETNKKTEAVLNPEQSKRLKEISLQFAMQTQGLAAVLANPEHAKALKLTEDQNEAVKTISEETQKQMRELFTPGGDPTGAREKMAELRKNADEEYAAILTDEQKEQIETMKGAKFELDMSAFGQRGGRGRGNRGGGGKNN
ncbi:MAG: hypothetical protein ACKV0T_09965 [Planctomycetales bacterium]